MHSLEVLAPVSAAPAPGKKQTQTPEPGADFASEFEALGPRPRPDEAQARVDPDAADTALPPEAEVVDEGQDPEVSGPVQVTEEDAPKPKAELVLAGESLPRDRIALPPDALTQKDGVTPAPAKAPSEGLGATSGPAIRGESGPAPVPARAVKDGPVAGMATIPPDEASKESAALRNDTIRPSSASEIALNASLRASAQAGSIPPVAASVVRPETLPAVAVLDSPEAELPPETLPENRVRTEARPAESLGLISPSVVQTAAKRPILPEMDRRVQDPVAAKEAPKAPTTPVMTTQTFPAGISPAMQAPPASIAPALFASVADDAERITEREVFSLGVTGGSDGIGRAAISSMPPHLQAFGPSVAQQIAAQVGAQIAQRGGGTTEIVLDPQELGRVSLSLNTQDGGITVAIAAERPETAELIRRNLDGLSQELRQLGYAEVNVGFADLAGQSGGQDSQTGETAQDSDVSEVAPTETAPPPSPGSALPGSGLDLRL